jgi:hypothetical protein
MRNGAGQGRTTAGDTTSIDVNGSNRRGDEYHIGLVVLLAVVEPGTHRSLPDPVDADIKVIREFNPRGRRRRSRPRRDRLGGLVQEYERAAQGDTVFGTPTGFRQGTQLN